MSEELAEPMFVRNMRRLAQGEQLHDPALSARLLLAEFDRLRLVELAATALVEQVWDEETQTFCCVQHLRSGLDALAAAVRPETP